MYTGFWWGDLREGDNLEDLSVDWRMILKRIFKMWNEGMEWIDLAQYSDRWRDFVTAVMTLGVP